MDEIKLKKNAQSFAVDVLTREKDCYFGESEEKIVSEAYIKGYKDAIDNPVATIKGNIGYLNPNTQFGYRIGLNENIEYKNEKGFTKEELIELGINYDNMNYPFGEMNVIVQWFGRSKVNEDGTESDYAYPDIYMPRKNRVWSVTDNDINLSNEDDRKDFIKHLRDSAERLKIWSLLLSRQASELEETGYTDTVCYYPEERQF